MSVSRFSPGGCCCTNTTVLLVVDTTGSMLDSGTGGYNKMRGVFDLLDDHCDRITLWGAVQYKDDGDIGYADGWEVIHTFTSSKSVVDSAIASITPGGGGDTPEQGFRTLVRAADEWETTLGGPSDDTRVVIWAGDAPSHNGFSTYPTRATVIAALQAAGITVMVFNYTTALNPLAMDAATAADGMTGAATQIAADTGGTLYDAPDSSDAATIAAAICAL